MNELDFSGRQVLVVGGSSGIGNGIAQAFRASGEFLGRSDNPIIIHDAPPRGSAQVTDQARRSSFAPRE